MGRHVAFLFTDNTDSRRSCVEELWGRVDIDNTLDLENMIFENLFFRSNQSECLYPGLLSRAGLFKAGFR